MVQRYADVEDISFGLVSKKDFLPVIEEDLQGVSFENFNYDDGDMNIVVISKNNGVQQFNMNDENYLHMDSLIGKAALSDGIESLSKSNLRIIDAINQPIVLLTHKGQTLPSLDKYNAIQNSNLVYAT